MVMIQLLLLAWLEGVYGQPTLSNNTKSQSELCPNIYPSVFTNYVPIGGIDNNTMAYNYKNTTDINQCVSNCCSNQECNSALIYPDGKYKGCWLVSCKEDRLCLPVKLNNENIKSSSMALVRPLHSPWNLESERSVTPSVSPQVSDVTVCEVGVDLESCNSDEVCKPQQDKSRNGVCMCKPGLIRDRISRKCLAPVPTPTAPPVAIVISVASKTVQLPLNSASLSAYTVPTETKDNPFKYEWKLVSMVKPSGTSQTAVEKNPNSQTLKLSGLVEGVYQFKVTVTSQIPISYGEALANVTVLAPKRINTPPKAVIVPLSQTVNLPTDKAIVDGSGSTDDSGQPLTFTWEISLGPVGYQPELPQSPTLTLENLTAGNYTIRLTVRDEEGGSDTATARLQVIKDTDYKPNANAGEDKIIFLPLNSVTLNGNKSYDDHSIKTYEWTKEKGADGKEWPADISGARSEYMTASNLEEGIYNFVLRVADAAGQSDTDTVAVYVKPPTNLPPTAKAGQDQALSLPISFFILDGSASTDDGNITSHKWTLLKGPEKRPVISSPESARTNVTNLTVGQYTFQLSVTDNNDNSAIDTVDVTIKQDTNQAPVANPGPDIKVSLPEDTVILDGRGSTDDLAIERWSWERDQSSLSAGNIVGKSSGPILTVTGLVSGSYKFSLTVTDGQGKSDSKSVKVAVSEDPEVDSDVEIVLDKNLSHLTQKEKIEVLDRIRVMTKGNGEISVRHVKLFEDHHSNLATLRFKVFSNVDNKMIPLPGPSVVNQLKRELLADPELLSVPVILIQTVICQNSCGGHGTCDQVTRECVCHPAWMENLMSRLLEHGEPNCNWSIVYVGVIVGVTTIIFFLLCCVVRCKQNRRKVAGKMRKKYSRLKTAETGMDMEGSGEDGSTLIHSETESDEEVLFESAKKGQRLNGSIPRNGNGFLRNGKSAKQTA